MSIKFDKKHYLIFFCYSFNGLAILGLRKKHWPLITLSPHRNPLGNLSLSSPRRLPAKMIAKSVEPALLLFLEYS